jgi:hypothetical protein
MLGVGREAEGGERGRGRDWLCVEGLREWFHEDYLQDRVGS